MFNFFSWILISVNGSRRDTVLDLELFSKKESMLEAHENMSIRCNCFPKETLSNWRMRTSTEHIDSLQHLIYQWAQLAIFRLTIQKVPHEKHDSEGQYCLNSCREYLLQVEPVMSPVVKVPQLFPWLFPWNHVQL